MLTTQAGPGKPIVGVALPAAHLVLALGGTDRRRRLLAARLAAPIASTDRRRRLLETPASSAVAAIAGRWRELEEVGLVATPASSGRGGDREALVARSRRSAWSRRRRARPRRRSAGVDQVAGHELVCDSRVDHTDTHGFTEQLFGLCHLFGISFMSRLKDQQLYWIDRASSHGAVDALYRGVVDVALIRDQYDALVRIASSLRNRTAPAHVVLERLAASSDRPARALTMIGRLVKTIHILRYLQMRRSAIGSSCGSTAASRGTSSRGACSSRTRARFGPATTRRL